MNNIWHLKKFSELTTAELYQIIKLRIDVFVVEQQCIYADLDNLDHHPDTLHLFCYGASPAKPHDEIIAYLRILPKKTRYPNNISIGRVLVAKKVRGSGLGHQLMANALKCTNQLFPKENIKISAQHHLQGFYQHHGFVATGQPYLEDDIEHIAMLKL